MKTYEQFRAEMKAMLATNVSFNTKNPRGDTERIRIPALDDEIINKAPMYELYKLCMRAEKLEKDRLKVVKRAQDAASAMRRLGWVEKAIGQAQKHINKPNRRCRTLYCGRVVTDEEPIRQRPARILTFAVDRTEGFGRCQPDVGRRASRQKGNRANHAKATEESNSADSLGAAFRTRNRT